MAPSSEDPEASPSVQEDQESGGSSAGVVGGVLLALLVAVAAVFGVFYYRCKVVDVSLQRFFYHAPIFFLQTKVHLLYLFQAPEGAGSYC